MSKKEEVTKTILDQKDEVINEPVPFNFEYSEPVIKQDTAMVTVDNHPYQDGHPLTKEQQKALASHEKRFGLELMIDTGKHSSEIILGNDSIKEVFTTVKSGVHTHGKTVTRHQRAVTSRSPKTGEETTKPRASVKTMTGHLPRTKVKEQSSIFEELLAKG